MVSFHPRTYDFRETALTFKVSEQMTEEEVKRLAQYKYPAMKKRYNKFQLEIEAGSFTDSEIIVMLGENGTGKTTFIKMLAGRLQPDEGGTLRPRSSVTYIHMALHDARCICTHVPDRLLSLCWQSPKCTLFVLCSANYVAGCVWMVR